MSKAVLLSIKPHYCEIISSGQKTVEVRKTRPKIETPFKCYIYCTVGKSPKDMLTFAEYENGEYMGDYWANGKVIGEFVCDKVDRYPFVEDEDEVGMIYPVSTAEGEKTCLEYDEVEKYGSGKPLYFWHISDLVIYDKPKELSEFRKYISFLDGESIEELEAAGINNIRIKKAPQSWCYVEDLR